ncbi:MAG: LamG-like jellyroll fold domain-containing protein [Planctomycetota bacterium]|jgi:hypothetical protein
MCRKLVFLVFLVSFVLGLANSASAAEYEWTNTGVTESWCDEENWFPTSPIGGPGPADIAVIFWPEQGPVIDCDVDIGGIEGPNPAWGDSQVVDVESGTVVAGWWEWRDGEGTATINISGTNDITIGGEYWRAPDRGMGILNISGDPNVVVYGDLRGADETGWFIINMSSGSLRCYRLAIGDEGGGELNISGDSEIVITGNMDLGGDRGDESITVNMTGGLITVEGELMTPSNTDRDGAVTINFDGGTIDCGSFSHADVAYLMDIEEGMLKISGDVVIEIEADIDAGYITAFDGSGVVEVAYEPDPNKTIVTGSLVHEKAYNPSPEHHAEYVCPGVELSWSVGEYVYDHNVYFGDSLSDVNESATPVEEHWGFNSWFPSNVELGTTYYWRVDGVNDADPNLWPNTWKGGVWTFTTNDGNAYDSYPVDNQTVVPVDVNLSWSPGCYAGSHDIYLGTDFNDVRDATSVDHPNVVYGNVVIDSFDPPGLLEPGQTYYWRVDEVNEDDPNLWPNFWEGDVWSFTAAGGILAHYKFDETVGDIAADSSGHGFDASVSYSGPGDPNWDPGGHFYGCLAFDDDTAAYPPPLVLGYIDKEITFSVWLNGAYREEQENWIFDTGEGDFFLRAAVVTAPQREVLWRAGNDSDDVLLWNLDGQNPRDLGGEWHHWAFVKDENEGVMGIYHNGVVAAEKAGTATNTLAGVRNTQFDIGAIVANAADYIGKMDDFRVYDYAMSTAEIANLFREGTDLGLAWNPNPWDGDKGVLPSAVLSWSPGDYAVSHDVYFGPNGWLVDSRDPSTYKGRQDADSYDPCGFLELGQTYYWAVDEVNSTHPNNPWPGDVWSFTVHRVHHVDPNSPGPNHNGSSWMNAFIDLQDALEVAQYGDHIWVAEGAYRPSQPTDPCDARTATFQLIDGVAIYGGFPSGGGSWDNRDPNTYETILSGDRYDNDVDVNDPCDLLSEPTRGENCYHVVTASGTSRTAVLDGFTITGGNANGAYPDSQGGGLQCGVPVGDYSFESAGGPTVVNCTFTRNSADRDGGGLAYSGGPVINCTFTENYAGDDGGAVHFCSGPITDCNISGNSAGDYGGGLYRCSGSIIDCIIAYNIADANGGGGMYNYESSPVLVNCEFIGNTALEGGGIYDTWGGNPTLTNCSFVGNSAKRGGGMYNDKSSPTVRGCTFIDNPAEDYGGGMFNINYSSPTVSRSTFFANWAYYGGGMCNYSSSPTLTNCIFTGNLVGWGGGGVYNSNSNAMLTNCIFTGNSAAYGGGMYTDDSSPVLTNCTFSGNSADSEYGGMYSCNSSPTLSNSILWGNTDSGGQDESAQIYGGTPEVVFSCIQDDDPNDGYIPFGGEDNNNIDDYPLFVRDPNDGGDGWGDDPCTPGVDESENDDFGDLHLVPGSKCIDAGDNNSVPPDVADLDGDGNTTEQTPRRR